VYFQGFAGRKISASLERRQLQQSDNRVRDYRRELPHRHGHAPARPDILLLAFWTAFG
jgi:hypothetical protein